MANKPTKQKGLSTNSVIALAAVGSLIIIFVFVAAERTLWSSLSKNNRIISKKQTAESQLKTNLNNLPGLDQQYQQLGSGLVTKINDSIPETSDFPGLVATMEAISGSSNMTLLNVTPVLTAAIGSSPSSATAATSSTATAQPINGASNVTSLGISTPQEFDFSVQLNGKYSDTLQFLSKLQLSTRPIKITTMTISGVTNATQVTINMATYYYKPAVLTDKTEAVK